MENKIKAYNLIITGVGGQGNVLSSKIIGEVFIKEGYYVTIGETYGSSQRGGSVMSHVRISDKRQQSPLIPEGKADLVLALEPIEALRVLVVYGNQHTITITNTRPYYPVDVNAGEADYPDIKVIMDKLEKLSKKVYYIDATNLAIKIGDPILTNMIMLGAFIEAADIKIDFEAIINSLENIFDNKKLKTNVVALHEGIKNARNNNLNT